jgi:hypothetical protein
VWHAFVCSPASEGIPGQQYFAGTHLNPLVTWWDKSAPFFDYINRCQALLQQGLPVADVAYYYGDHVPNFARLRKSDPARIGAGYDYDVVTEEVILKRMKAKSGRLVLPDGVSYRLLVLPERTVISLPVLKKLKEFVSDGAIIVGPKPTRSTSLKNYPDSDEEMKSIADKLWSNKNVISDKIAREVLLANGVRPDFEVFAPANIQSSPSINFIHRRDGNAEIYFVASRTTNAVAADCAFRITGKAPELWNAVTGDRKFAAGYEEKDGRTIIPLVFDPCGSWFVIFRESSAKHPASAQRNVVSFTPLEEIAGPWTVSFDPKWGGPESSQFESLVDWTKRPESGIKFYSGTAVYRKSFDAPTTFAGKSVWLDLGDVRELAEVKVNGQSCGITWAPPFRVDISRVLKAGANQLEVEVVNFWPNRIIGDVQLPKEKRLTKTNIRKLTSENQMMRSGLFGPVKLVELGK